MKNNANFALIGVAGYVAPRHLRAIRDVGGRVIAAVDPHDSVGIIDSFFPDARFFTEIERFDRHLEKLRRKGDAHRVHYVSICSPNYLHDAHVRLALRLHAHAICEKPLVINPWNLAPLAELEAEYRQHVYTVLQLRLHEAAQALKRQMKEAPSARPLDVELTYITPRGAWYETSWKGDPAKSGGVAMNIGIHFFDLLLWLFGGVRQSHVHLRETNKMAGILHLEKANVRWFLSLDRADLPQDRPPEQTSYRCLKMEGRNIDFSSGFTDLHTEVYRQTLGGRGFTIADARPSIELVYKLRTQSVEPPGKTKPQ